MNQDRFGNNVEGPSVSDSALLQVEVWVAYGQRLDRNQFHFDWLGRHSDGLDKLGSWPERNSGMYGRRRLDPPGHEANVPRISRFQRLQHIG
jgi:hypothetical protein